MLYQLSYFRFFDWWRKIRIIFQRFKRLKIGFYFISLSRYGNKKKDHSLASALAMHRCHPFCKLICTRCVWTRNASRTAIAQLPDEFDSFLCFITAFGVFLEKTVCGWNHLCNHRDRNKSVCLHFELQPDTFRLAKLVDHFDDYGPIYCDWGAIYYESLSNEKKGKLPGRKQVWLLNIQIDVAIKTRNSRKAHPDYFLKRRSIAFIASSKLAYCKR